MLFCACRITDDLAEDSDGDQSLLDGSMAPGSCAGAGAMFQTAAGPPPSVAGSMVSGKEWIPKGASASGAAGWFAEFSISSFDAAEDAAMEDSRGIAANFRVVHRLVLFVLHALAWP